MDRLFCKGYTWGWCAKKGEFQSQDGIFSMERLHSNGTDWICIAVNAYQETFSSTRIFPLFGITQSDEDVVFAIQKAKNLGMKVCLKPIVNCLDRAWRARIDFPGENPEYWVSWFKSYTNFMLHYAEIAEKTGCEMLCTGCEMAGMDAQDAHCRRYIAQVRKVYSGILMHNVNHGDELRFNWLDAVDVVGISAYYRVSTPDDHSPEQMKKVWAEKKQVLFQAHKKYGKPILFAEIGVRNEQGCTEYPWDFHNRPDKPIDEREQADFYNSAMQTFWNEPWFSGFFWWDWRAKLPSPEKAPLDRDFGIYLKQAETVLRDWYTK
ncbi:MAG: hypothetical protein QM689_06840 [Oscillospiraceae bacterium]